MDEIQETYNLWYEKTYHTTDCRGKNESHVRTLISTLFLMRNHNTMVSIRWANEGDHLYGLARKPANKDSEYPSKLNYDYIFNEWEHIPIRKALKECVLSLR